MSPSYFLPLNLLTISNRIVTGSRSRTRVRMLFVFLLLAAQYESWALPLAIILIVPMCLLAAIAGVYLRQMDNNISFVVLQPAGLPT